MQARSSFLFLAAAILFGTSASAAVTNSAADQALAAYFQRETSLLADNCLAEVRDLDDWNARRGHYRQQLFEMLGLDPLPGRTDLKPETTGKIEHDSFIVEKLHFQSMPGLYVTANLYLPKHLTNPAPTILYVCGHGPVITNGISYGNKVTYQHHGAWFARNGYVCMIIDTLQLGEIQGLHHGTHRQKLWWWNSRGYTPAGVEAWNSIRALDYLATRPEVDTNRFGVTGRSGGGAYSWWLVALDDRIKVAAPVAGVTDLHNHVIDGVVEGHCDCMFIVHTWRWDYPQVAALAAPRPLLIVNTDSDRIFPLDGVMRTHEKVRRIYQFHKAATNLGVVIGPGPHKDTQDIQVPVFRWFNRHFKGEDTPIEMAATKFFTAEQLKVFDVLPADAINTNIHHTFVPSAKPAEVPASQSAWRAQRDMWLAALQQKSFAGWPKEATKPKTTEKSIAVKNGFCLEVHEFESQPHVPLRLYVLAPNVRTSTTVRLTILDDAGQSATDFNRWLSVASGSFAHELGDELALASSEAKESGETFEPLTNTIHAFLAPRGIALGAWSGDDRKQTHLRRRFMLLGQTLEGMRVWDIRRAVQLVRKRWPAASLELHGHGSMGVNALYASMFEGGIDVLKLDHLPPSQMEGPDYLNCLRIIDLPEALAIAAERCNVVLDPPHTQQWHYAETLAKAFGWPKSPER